MKYAVSYKRFSELHNNFVLVTENIDAVNFYVTEVGAVLFVDDYGSHTRAIPPGAWTLVEPAAIGPEQPATLIQP